MKRAQPNDFPQTTRTNSSDELRQLEIQENWKILKTLMKIWRTGKRNLIWRTSSLKKRMISTTRRIWKTRTTVPLPSYSDLLLKTSHRLLFRHEARRQPDVNVKPERGGRQGGTAVTCLIPFLFSAVAICLFHITSSIFAL